MRAVSRTAPLSSQRHKVNRRDDGKDSVGDKARDSAVRASARYGATTWYARVPLRGWRVRGTALGTRRSRRIGSLVVRHRHRQEVDEGAVRTVSKGSELMLFCIAPVPSTSLRLEDVRHAVEATNLDVGFNHKTLADLMGFPGERIGMYYRQLRTHGLNLNLLLNAGPRWWLAFLVRICRLLGITQQQIATAFGLAFQTEEEVQREREERDARDREIDQRLRRLERLAGVPAAVPDPSADKGSRDEDSTPRSVGGPGRRDRVDDGDEHLLPLQVPVQINGAVRNLLDLRG